MIRKLLVAILAIVVVCQTAATPAFAGPAGNALGAAASGAVVAAAPISATDPSKVPHYFGPYPNWANSPQVLSNAIVTLSLGTPTPVSYGNPLTERAYATDYATPPGALGPVFVVLSNTKLPAGTLQNFQTWNQGSLGGSPTTSAGNLFHAYVLRPTAVANQYTVVYDSGQQTVPAPTVGTGEVNTVTVPAVAVQADDVIGFYGEGIPVDTGATVNPDTLSYPATADPTLATNVAPAQGATLTLGVDAGFPILSQDRTYSFAATVTPTVTDPGTGALATATVDPKTGAISAVTVTSPGSGYLIRPTVTITSPGVTPTTLASATAQISSGVITSIAVNETGFGFTAPAVTITGGGPATNATATASGGVDNVTVNAGGGGVYNVQPIVKFGLPDLPGGVQATGTATMVSLDATATPPTFAIDQVTVVDPGSGYTSAPSVTIFDGTPTQVAPTPAATTATIGIAQIDLVNPGAGYTSAPTVTIRDAGGIDKGASATATVAVKGAVTGITVTNPGAGYLTPGLKKFVDTLPGLTESAANNLGQYIPVAVPDTTTYPGSDYYEIAIVQYRHQFASSLPATLLRGYVQLSTSVVPGKHTQLTNANLDPNVAATQIAGYFGVDNPHYLGPTIVANKDRPTRILFRNLLPTGVAGDLFLPVDTSLMGSGAGPDMMKLDGNGVPKDMAPDLGTVLDGVRNPMCADTPKPVDPATQKGTCFSEDRATLHLHGGITPWISDGTPHQWITPAGENTAYPKGVSVSNVPDMPDPGAGAQTFFYTNQQSARLMFYHDHAWGITRLNVYAGEAAGYLLTDPMEQSLIAPGGALDGLGVGSPLIVQDKTFVPDAATMAKQDPTWDYAKWGGPGNLWTPHVYMPAQNPGDPSGMSAFGRWMYGPWFWPPAKDVKYPPIHNPYYLPPPVPGSPPDPLTTCDPNVQPFCEPELIPSTPNVSVGMEAFNDTPIVNGTAYPTTTVDPKAYRYRVLNAANDRFWNLSWYVADDRTGTLSEVALNPAELAAAQTDPVVVPTPDTTKSPKGPNWIQIGTEGGFLPAPVVVPAQPTTWITDPTRFDVGNVDLHSLLLAPAERADVVVDFSQYRGKTLILYNDAPAAFPARVPGYDYYTGGPDLTPSGAPTTLPGYGPNTRTVMQVKVSTAVPAVAFDRPNTTADRLGALEAAFAHKADGSGVFESGSDPIIVGQAAYNTAYGTNFATNGWCNAPGSTSTTCDGFARIAEGSQPTDKFGFNTLAAPTAKMQIPFEPKGMHDEMNSASFDEWGRMTANLGLEAPGATPLTQNIILYPFVNPATEVLDASGLPSSLDVTPISSATDGTQIWKITHNGVDTHPIHFHLYDVQVINRVTWDNIIIPPEPTELGWKDTVRVSPLEDTIVAVRPIVPTLPFGIPDSHRPLNPMMPIGARGDPNALNGVQAGFNNTDANGNPIAPIVNQIVDFGWEYVFHCHILSHEEMDMMRPVTVHVARAAPQAPVLSFARGSVILTWTDGTPVDYLAPVSWGNSGTAEVGYRIERAEVIGGVTGPYTVIATAPANGTTYTDLTADPALAYDYRVTAWNAAGDSPSNVIRVSKPGSTTVVTNTPNPSQVGEGVTFTATVTSLLAPGTPTGTVTFTANGATVAVPVDATGAATFSKVDLPAGTHTITADYGGDAVFASSSGSAIQTVNKTDSTIVVVSNLNPSAVGQNVTFTATVSPTTATGTVQFTIDGTVTSAPVTAGQAILSISALTVGGHVVGAAYSGDPAFNPSSSSTFTQTVGPALRDTRTVVTSNRAPSTFGQAVTFTATVRPVTGTGIPSGTVQFNVDGANVGGVLTLNAQGRATYSTAALSAGNHNVIATYGGSANYLGSPSANLTQTVNKATSRTVVISSGSPAAPGTPVVFTATVTAVAPGAGIPTGSVQFRIDGLDVVGAAVTLNASGQAAYATSTMSLGLHTVSALYSGDNGFNSSASRNINQRIR